MKKLDKKTVINVMQDCYSSTMLLASKLNVTATEIDQFFEQNPDVYIAFTGQIHNLTRKSLQSLESLIEEGDFKAIKLWLDTNATEMGFGKNEMEVNVNTVPQLVVSFDE